MYEYPLSVICVCAVCLWSCLFYCMQEKDHHNCEKSQVDDTTDIESGSSDTDDDEVMRAVRKRVIEEGSTGMLSPPPVLASDILLPPEYSSVVKTSF